jgi:two-component system cell cycle sensor histidine kinase/response regulator CckA
MKLPFTLGSLTRVSLVMLPVSPGVTDPSLASMSVMTLLLAPALWVALDVVERVQQTSWRALAERGLALLALVGAITAVTLNPVVAGVSLPISIVAVPVLLLAGYRYGVSFTAWAAVTMLATVLVLTAADAGPFAAARAPGYARFVAAELYVGAVGISLVLLAAVLSDLRASAERFQSFLDTVDTAIIAVDLDRRIVGFSSAANRIFLDSAKRPLYLGLDPLGPLQGSAESMERRRAGWSAALRGESDVATLTPDDATRMEMRYEPMRNSHGAVVGAVATATDLVKREQAEQARVRAERLEAIGRLAGGIAHDVNNLMTIVLGQTYLLRAEVPAHADATAALDEIDATIERTTRLTTQLLAFSRAQVTTPRVVTLAAQVDASAILLRRIVEENTIIEVDHRGAPASVTVDIGQFEQILLNLATNARDAMPDGGRLWLVTDTVTLAPSDAESLGIVAGEYATLQVRDSGHGIATELLDDIFEPFFTTKGANGTGLGLATVYAVMRKAAGAVRVTSTTGAGTTFTMWFPRTAVAPDNVQTPIAPTPSHRAGVRVLVCEDDASIRRLVVRTLAVAGLSVHDAPTPAEALAWLDGEGWNTELLVSDIIMPEMSGVELMRQARQRIPELRVLLMTGYADDALRGLSAAERPDRVMSKPFTVAALLACVAELTNGPPIASATTAGVR